MAQNFKAELKNKKSVLAYYELCDNPKYCIYIGTNTLSGNMVLQWLDEENTQGGLEQLQKYLNFIEEEESNTNIYTFQSVTKTIPKKFKGEEVLQCEGLTQRFQLHEMVFASPKQNNNVVAGFDNSKDYAIYERIFEMMNKQNELFSHKFQELEYRLQAAKEEETEEEEEEEEEKTITGKDKFLGAIGSLLQREGIQNTLEMGAMAIMAKLSGINNENK